MLWRKLGMVHLFPWQVWRNSLAEVKAPWFQDFLGIKTHMSHVRFLLRWVGKVSRERQLVKVAAVLYRIFPKSSPSPFSNPGKWWFIATRTMVMTRFREHCLFLSICCLVQWNVCINNCIVCEQLICSNNLRFTVFLSSCNCTILPNSAFRIWITSLSS